MNAPAIAPQTPADAKPQRGRPPIAILGVPFDNLTFEETVELIADMIRSRQPHYLATANVDFVVQVQEDIELRRILFDAHAVLCDGMPLVWASRWLGNALVERVTGSDLVPRLLIEAERRGWRVFFLGGTQASVAQAAANTVERHPRLRLVGAYSPPFKPLLEMDQGDILKRISAASPDLLLVAFGCPKQEKWINMHYRHLGVPVSIGVGATLDFLAGSFKRAPVWMQRAGLEWVFRLAQEPGRLARRYGKDFWVFSRAVWRQSRELRSRRDPRPNPAAPPPPPAVVVQGPTTVIAPGRLDAAAAAEFADTSMAALADRSLIVDLSPTQFIDSTGVAALVRLRKRAREMDRALVLAGIQSAPLNALRVMRLESFFSAAADISAARAQLGFEQTPAVAMGGPEAESLRWVGEITAATLSQFADSAQARLDSLSPGARVRVDLAAVSFADSSGVGLMVALKKRAHRRDVHVCYANPTPAVANVLRLTRLAAYLTAPNP